MFEIADMLIFFVLLCDFLTLSRKNGSIRFTYTVLRDDGIDAVVIRRFYACVRYDSGLAFSRREA